MKPTIVSSSKDNTQKLKAALAKLQKAQVYVGVPEEKGSRSKAAINNAQLVYIHTHGSPLRHIPPRPIIEPAIKAPGNKELITGELGKAAQAVLGAQPSEAHSHLERAGMLGRNAAIRWFNDPRNNWAPNAPATVARKGSDHPLIDTAQMRRSITYVVEE
jgi:hypothetical protein